MKPGLLELLRCPDCGGRLELEARERSGAEVLEGRLACRSGHGFPVVRGVPRFVADEAYAGSFGLQWNLHARTQFDGPRSNESYETFIQKTGLREPELRGRLALEAGCGAGRFMDVVSRMGGECVGVDLSAAVEACYANLGSRPGMHVVQADIFRLPFAPETFDAAYSIGVLHHTPDTRRAFLRLPPLVRPGGYVSIWVYDSYWYGVNANARLRRLTTRLPRRLLYALCSLAAPYYYVKKIPLAGRLLQLALPASDHPDWRWRWLDTFDWYSPVYQWKHRYPEVARWFKEAGLVDIEPLEPPVAVRGRKAGLPPRQPGP